MSAIPLEVHAALDYALNSGGCAHEAFPWITSEEAIMTTIRVLFPHAETITTHAAITLAAVAYECGAVSVNAPAAS